MKFSERLGFQPVRELLQVEEMDKNLKNSLWSVFLDTFLDRIFAPNYDYPLPSFVKSLWFDFFKLPIDASPIQADKTVNLQILKEKLKAFFFNNNSEKWYNPYDLLEFSVPYADTVFLSEINRTLEREKSAFRFVSGRFTQITSETEILEIEEAIASTDNMIPIHTHLNTALSLLAVKINPDFRNSMKESISAVEAAGRVLTNNPKALLGESLTQLETSGILHASLKKAFVLIYGYTSDDGGIRHSLKEGQKTVDFHDAKFLLVTCSAFINLLLGKKK